MDWRVYRSWKNTVLVATLNVAACLAAGTLSPCAFAQQDRNDPFGADFPFTNPDGFFKQLFGQDTEEDRKSLEQVDIPRREEHTIGSRAVEAYLDELNRRKVRVVSRGPEVEYLRSLVEVVRPSMRQAARYASPRVLLALSDESDARAFPGGTLIFFKGMLDLAENEAALVGVIGHELSHLDHGHQLYHVKRLKQAQQSFGRGGSPDRFFQSGMLLARSFMRPFRPEEESQADRDGARWAFDAGYDPREMAELFLRMHERSRGAPKNVPAFFLSHPYHLDRYEAVLRQTHEMKAEEADAKLYVGRENLRQRVPRSVQEFAD